MASPQRDWVRDYQYQKHRRACHHDAVIHRQFPEQSVLTFLELVELLFIRMFRDHGVSWSTIRRASERAAEQFGTPCPFAVRRFDTDGNRIFDPCP